MIYNRKEFLQTGLAAAGSLAIGPQLTKLLDADAKLKTFGIQVYTVRDVFEKDPKGVLKQLAAFGYKQIESYERNTGMFWGMKNTEFKSYMDELGMTIVASHCDIDKEFDRKAAEAAAIGMKYIIAAWEGDGKSIEDYKKLAEKYNEKAAIAKKNGIRFAFHNHWFSFEKKEDQFPQDILMQYTDASLVDFEMDIYWVAATRQDPVTWLKKYPNRFKLCHIKDRVKGSTKRTDTCDLGTGSIDFPTILKAARKNGMEYYLAEQEDYKVSSLESAKVGAEYLRRIRI